MWYIQYAGVTWSGHIISTVQHSKDVLSDNSILQVPLQCGISCKMIPKRVGAVLMMWQCQAHTYTDGLNQHWPCTMPLRSAYGGAVGQN
jgi:hypothetical protein